MKKKYGHLFFLLIFSSFPWLFSQTGEFLGVWENGGRFVEFLNSGTAERKELKMRIVLKPYYKFVYDDSGEFTVYFQKAENSKSRIYLSISYPYVKKRISLPVCIQQERLFTSFYKRIKYIKNGNPPPAEDRKNILCGFWIEQGNREGILLHPNEIPNSIDAYFFTENAYIKFRYWLDDLVYDEKYVFVKEENNIQYEFPKFLKRGGLVYSCVTNNGRVLRNYEKGSYSIGSDKNAADGKGLFLSLNPKAAGPGANAVADTYPHPKFPVMENLPLYMLDDNLAFAIGEPYLLRSCIDNLDEEIKKHNKKE